nr:hypothetical protein GCM10020092_055250 [Actinoplanes digitatis]
MRASPLRFAAVALLVLPLLPVASAADAARAAPVYPPSDDIREPARKQFDVSKLGA